MSLGDIIKQILGHKPPETQTLAKHATHSDGPPQLAASSQDSVQEIQITEDYKKAIALIEAEVPIIFITGRAGTGKSTFIKFIRQKYLGSIAVVAPTGVAALNAGGVTIHSFFRFPPRVINPEDVKTMSDKRLFRALKILVIDEVSMVRADVLDAMDKFLRLNGRDPRRPFGGIQVLLVGDLAQLPPVVATPEEVVLFTRRYTSPFFWVEVSLFRFYAAC